MRGKLVPHCERPQGHVKEFGLDSEGHRERVKILK